MIAHLLLSVLCFPATGAEVLTPELLVDHPGLREGAYETVREDWLSALEAEPGSPLAYSASLLIRDLADHCHAGLAPARLEALAERVEDGAASFILRNVLLGEIRARSFSAEPYLPEGDLFDDFLGSWHVLGPYGPMTEGSPLYRRDPEAPENRLTGIYPAMDGKSLTWRELRRPRQQSSVYPTAPIFPDTGGVSYLLTFVKAPSEEALLEVSSFEAFEVFWNGTLCIDCRRDLATEQVYRFTAPVRLGTGWNALLIRFPTAGAPNLAARLLDLEGRRLEVEEAEWNGRDLPEWSATPPASLTPPPPTPPGSFEEVLGMLVATIERRADEALAIPEPADAAVLPAWLRARHDALSHNAHLPGEVDRRLQIEVEERLEELGVTFPSIELHRADRLIGEDKPDEALAIAEALVTASPDVVHFRWMRVRCLLALDPSGALVRPQLFEILERCGDHAPTLRWLGRDAADAGDWVGAVDLYQRLLRAEGLRADELDRVLGWLVMDHEGLSTEVEAWLEAWLRDFPGDEYVEELLVDLWFERGDVDALRALLEQNVQSGRFPVGTRLGLARSSVMDGHEEEVVSLLREVLALAPGRHGAHRTLELLGVPDEAEEFFSEFTPDVEAARAMAVSTTDASTALVLDSGMVYMRPDGASRYRTHSIQLALDRTGTERLHEEPAHANTRVARVLDADGKVFEPILVDGTWVWPSLDPGDAVEQEYDQFTGSTPGTIPSVGGWYFASFEQPFIYSRYVFFVPDGLAGEWRQERFEGTHEEIPWRGGVVHVFLHENQPRYKEEPLRPSNDETLPWVRYGVDLSQGEIVADFRRYIRHLSGVAADLRVELEPIVAATEGTTRERAEALFDVVTDRVLEFTEDGDTTDVWSMRRGAPTGLLAALFTLAGIEYDWAILAPPIAPELDPDPEPAFIDHDHFGLPCLRVATGEGEEPLWIVVPPGGRDLAFGSIPDEFAGARAMILGESEEVEYEEVPRDDLADSWALDLDVVYHLGADGSTTASGTIRATGARGAFAREQLSRIEPQQRSQVARNLASQTVQGLDLEQWEFVDLDGRGAPLELKFTGQLPGFVQGTPPAQSCRLRLPPVNLSTSFGPAEREWPLAVLATNRTRARIRLECGEEWSYEYVPESSVETRNGFRYELEVQREESALEVRRIVELRGMVLEPALVPEFLTRCKEYEDAEQREVTLRRR